MREGDRITRICVTLTPKVFSLFFFLHICPCVPVFFFFSSSILFFVFVDVKFWGREGRRGTGRGREKGVRKLTGVCVCVIIAVSFNSFFCVLSFFLSFFVFFFQFSLPPFFYSALFFIRCITAMIAVWGRGE
ncbi:hypothetical protein, unlikely [Trypanosoma brucei gambiense DAL972]|uniref:Uncharacterized protein n=1 Tax=Trypanosoma brucei gambiense (strain MHOM/CI/86/DAL972) TaxID=679716 RepID=C9ZJ58_TRYB9|nr:hypothetical protein, unlikely [Trypanosoma brucei gambiense DAL972]CBH09416.1 hypothetical protein, unlikely [Trypanosoma brucei gambiense DAL972]|eukprot:XP_011771722.1 hypothetical protein, unlikely [Trypanosoma brucei gambiense DAL972]